VQAAHVPASATDIRQAPTLTDGSAPDPARAPRGLILQVQTPALQTAEPPAPAAGVAQRPFDPDSSSLPQRQDAAPPPVIFVASQPATSAPPAQFVVAAAIPAPQAPAPEVPRPSVQAGHAPVAVADIRQAPSLPNGSTRAVPGNEPALPPDGSPIPPAR